MYLYGEGGFLGEYKRIIYCIINWFIYLKMKDFVFFVDLIVIIEVFYLIEMIGVKCLGRKVRLGE